MQFWYKTALIAAILTVPLALHEGLKAEENDEETYRQLKLFGDVFERVRADYVEEVSDEELVEAAISGMLSSLDPHSSYLDADDFNEMQTETRGEFGGLGIEVTMEDGWVKVVSPIDDTPAARAGIEAGDFVTHLDGEPVFGMTLSEAVDRMRGEVDTNIVLTIVRGDQEPFDVSITRAVITVQSVRYRTEGEIGYIRITSFNEQTTPGLENAIESIEEELGDKLQGFVLDLRNNPGGLLSEAISVSDAFLNRGEIVSTRGRDPEQADRWNASSGDLAEGHPIVVLINGGSASASEIVAGALQDHDRAIVMGTQSFGKGSVQTVVPLGSHGAMRLTTSRYYTPAGRSIQATGIAPDILVEQARLEVLETNGSGRSEADLRGALVNPDEENGDASNGEGADESGEAAGDDEDSQEAKADTAIDDYQLARALDLLKGLALYRGQQAN